MAAWSEMIPTKSRLFIRKSDDHQCPNGPVVITSRFGKRGHPKCRKAEADHLGLTEQDSRSRWLQG